MSDQERNVREEVEAVHRFFVDWFNGSAAKDELDKTFFPRLVEEMIYVTPDGHRLRRDKLTSMLGQAHGGNPDFRIEVRDVKVLRRLGDHLLVTYTEWQKGAKASDLANNARTTTLLITVHQPFRWVHLQETWLPEEERAADPFDF